MASSQFGCVWDEGGGTELFLSCFSRSLSGDPRAPDTTGGMGDIGALVSQRLPSDRKGEGR